MQSLPDRPIKRSGFIAIVGRPNVGKSTLINRLVNAKVSITSAKAQTTRHRIVGIVEQAQTQFVFVDTPGFQTRQRGALNQILNRTVQQTLADVDVVVFVVEAGKWTPGDEQVLALLPTNRPVVLALNKIDLNKNLREQLDQAAQLQSRFEFKAIIPLSAQKGQGTEPLLAQVAEYLPEGDRLYEPDQLSDRNDRFLAAEIIREKVFRLTGDELPYTSTVVIEQFHEEGQLKRIFASILVQREAHKAMILGGDGVRIKRIASESRQDLERMWGGKVYLEVWVKVKSGWADSAASLRAYGYE